MVKLNPAEQVSWNTLRLELIESFINANVNDQAISEMFNNEFKPEFLSETNTPAPVKTAGSRWAQAVDQDGSLTILEARSTPGEYNVRTITADGAEKTVRMKDGLVQWELEADAHGKKFQNKNGIIMHSEDIKKRVKINLPAEGRGSTTSIDKRTGKIEKIMHPEPVATPTQKNPDVLKKTPNISKKVDANATVKTPLKYHVSEGTIQVTSTGKGGGNIADVGAIKATQKVSKIPSKGLKATLGKAGVKAGAKAVPYVGTALTVVEGMRLLNEGVENPKKVIDVIDFAWDYKNETPEMQAKMWDAFKEGFSKEFSKQLDEMGDGVVDVLKSAKELIEMPSAEKKLLIGALLYEAGGKMREWTPIIVQKTQGFIKDAQEFYDLPTDKKMEMTKQLLSNGWETVKKGAGLVYDSVAGKAEQTAQSTKTVSNYVKNRLDSER